MASIKLKEKVQIDDMIPRPDFSYNRGKPKEDGSFDIITGRVLGLRIAWPQRDTLAEDSPYTRVNLYGIGFEIEKENNDKWMVKFGTVFSYKEIMDREMPDYATGDISVKIKLRKDISSFLPMYGKKIRVAYRGMKTVCSNCFDVGHIKANCGSPRVSWILIISKP